MLQRIPAPQSFIQPPPALGLFAEVLSNLHVYFGVSNSGVLVTEEGVIIIDAQTSPGAAEQLYDKVRRLTDRPIRYVINTHYHGDHTYGNAAWASHGIPIVGLRLTAELMRIREQRMKLFYRSRGLPADGIPVQPPTIQFDEQLTLHLGGKDLRLYHLGPGETPDSIVVWLPQEKVLFTNDTMHCYGFPIFGQPLANEGLDGDGRFLDTLSKYEALGAEWVIPGHGHITDSSSIAKMREIAAFFLGTVNEHLLSGASFDQIYDAVQRAVPDEYRQMPPVWGSIDAAIRRAYHSLAGWLPYRPSALPSASEQELAHTLQTTTEEPAMLLRRAEELSSGQPGLALALCRHVIRRHPKHAHAYALQGEILVDTASRLTSLFDRGEYLPHASEALQKALSLDAADWVAQLNWGLLSVLGVPIFGGTPDPGMRLLESSMQHAPLGSRRVKALYGLSVAHRLQGNTAKAREYLEEALRLAPDFAEARALLDQLPAGTQS